MEEGLITESIHYSEDQFESSHLIEQEIQQEEEQTAMIAQIRKEFLELSKQILQLEQATKQQEQQLVLQQIFAEIEEMQNSISQAQKQIKNIQNQIHRDQHKKQTDIYTKYHALKDQLKYAKKKDSAQEIVLQQLQSKINKYFIGIENIAQFSVGDDKKNNSQELNVEIEKKRKINKTIKNRNNQICNNIQKDIVHLNVQHQSHDKKIIEYESEKNTIQTECSQMMTKYNKVQQSKQISHRIEQQNNPSRLVKDNIQFDLSKLSKRLTKQKFIPSTPESFSRTKLENRAKAISSEMNRFLMQSTGMQIRNNVNPQKFVNKIRSKVIRKNKNVSLTEIQHKVVSKINNNCSFQGAASMKLRTFNRGQMNSPNNISKPQRITFNQRIQRIQLLQKLDQDLTSSRISNNVQGKRSLKTLPKINLQDNRKNHFQKKISEDYMKILQEKGRRILQLDEEGCQS